MAEKENEIRKIASKLNLTSNTISIGEIIERELSEEDNFYSLFSAPCIVGGKDKLFIFGYREFYNELLQQFYIENVFLVIDIDDFTLTPLIPYTGEFFILPSQNSVKNIVSDGDTISVMCYLIKFKDGVDFDSAFESLATFKISENGLEIGEFSYIEPLVDNYFSFTTLSFNKLMVTDGSNYLRVESSEDEINAGFNIEKGLRIGSSVAFQKNEESIIGIFTEDSQKNSEVDVILSGVYEDDNYNLFPGKDYFVDNEGDIKVFETILSSKPVDSNGVLIVNRTVKIGKSLSPTKLLLNSQLKETTLINNR